MSRKGRVDSVSEAVRIAGASQPIIAPSSVPLDDHELGFFANIIAEYARADWTAHELEVAAMFAREMASMERMQRQFKEEGPKAFSEKGTPVVNPLKSVIQMHASAILSFRRSLSLHARAKGGEARDVAKRKAISKGIEADVDGGDDLLA